MNPERINTKQQYQEVMKRIEELIDLDVEPKSEQGYELNHLATICESYETITILKAKISELEGEVARLEETFKKHNLSKEFKPFMWYVKRVDELEFINKGLMELCSHDVCKKEVDGLQAQLTISKESERRYRDALKELSNGVANYADYAREALSTPNNVEKELS